MSRLGVSGERDPEVGGELLLAGWIDERIAASRQEQCWNGDLLRRSIAARRPQLAEDSEARDRPILLVDGPLPGDRGEIGPPPGRDRQHDPLPFDAIARHERPEHLRHDPDRKTTPRGAQIRGTGVAQNQPREIPGVLRAPLHGDHATQRHAEEAPGAGVLLPEGQPPAAKVRHDGGNSGGRRSDVLCTGPREIETEDVRFGHRGTQETRERPPVTLFTRETAKQQEVHGASVRQEVILQ